MEKHENRDNNIIDKIKKIMICICGMFVILLVTYACAYEKATSDVEKKYVNEIENTQIPVLTQQPTQSPPTEEPTQKPIATETPTEKPTAKIMQLPMVKQGVTYDMGTFLISYEGYKYSTDYQGNKIIIVDYSYTNLSEQNKTFSLGVTTKLFQDGVQLEEVYFARELDLSSSNVELQTGASIMVHRAYKLRSSTSLINMVITDWLGLGNKKIDGYISL